MNEKGPAPLTARLITRKRGASGANPPQPGHTAQPQQAKPVPPVRNIHPASPTVHAIDLTPPDFLRAENRGETARPQKNEDETS